MWASVRGPLACILRYTADPLVSRDILGDPSSCVLDSGPTQASGRLVKAFGWHDSEWGSACRLADLADMAGRQLQDRP